MAEFFLAIGIVILIIGIAMFMFAISEDEADIGAMSLLVLFAAAIIILFSGLSIARDDDDTVSEEPNEIVITDKILAAPTDTVTIFWCNTDPSETDNQGRIRYNCKLLGIPLMYYCHVTDMSGEWDKYSCSNGFKTITSQCMIGEVSEEDGLTKYTCKK